MLQKDSKNTFRRPPYILIFLISLLGLGASGWLAYQSWLTWSANTNEQTAMQMLLAGLSAFCFLLLAGVLVIGLLRRIRKLRKLQEAKESNIKYLRGEMNANLRELEIQSQMLFSFMNDGRLSQFMNLAAELLRVQNVSFWRLNPEESEMECMEAYGETKKSFQKGATVNMSQFPSLFSILKDRDCVQHPKGMQVGTEITGEPIEPGGSLLHYVENEQVKALLVIPLEVEGQVMGAAWFEHRELERQWTERDRKQAYFVASIVRMKLFKDLQYGIIDELAEGLVQFDNFRNQVGFGVGWFRLASGCALTQSGEAIKKELAKEAILEEANEGMMQVFDKQNEGIIGERLASFVNDIILEALVTNNFLVSEMEWERVDDGEREVLKISVFGNVKGTELIGLWLVVQDITPLKEKEWQVTSLIENSSNIISILNESNLITSDSPSIRQIGYETTERVGKNILSYFEPNDAEELEKALQACKSTQSEEIVTSLKMRQTDGWGYFDARIKNMLSDRHIQGVLLELTNISARMQKEDELHEQQLFFSNLIEQSGEVAFVMNKSGEIVYESANMIQIFGYKPSERIGHYGFELIHSNDLPELERALKRISEGKNQMHYQNIQLFHKNGIWKTVALSMQKGQHGAVNIWLKDMTGIREAELLLRNRENLTNLFLASSDKIFLLTDTKGKIKFATGCVHEIIGVTPNKLVGKTLHELVSKAEVEAISKNLQTLQDNPNATVEMHIMLKSTKGAGQRFVLKSKGKVLEKAYSGLLFELSILNDETVEKSIAIKADFFQSLVSGFPNALLFSDPEGVIKYTNPAVKELLGQIPKGNINDWVELENNQPFASLISEQNIDGLFYFRLGSSRKPLEVRSFMLKGSVVNGIVFHLTSPEIKQLNEEEGRSDALLEKLQDQLRYNLQDQTDLERKIAKLQFENDIYGAKLQKLATENQEKWPIALKIRLKNLLENTEQVVGNLTDIEDLLNKYREVNAEVDLENKLKEIGNFEELINFEIVLNETKSYIQELKQVANTFKIAEVPVNEID